MADPFVTVEEVSDYLGRDVDTDPSAQECVEFASDLIRAFTEQTFNFVAGDTVTLDGTGTDALLLPQVPVSAVGTVSVRDSDGLWVAAGSADYALNGDGVLYAIDTAGTFGASWPFGRQNVQVTYDHGYTIAGTTATIPRDVKGIAKLAASRMLIQGIAKAESVGDVNVTYAAESTGLTATEQMVLTKYRRHH